MPIFFTLLTRVNNSYSTLLEISFRVPHGSILRPLLFNISLIFTFLSRLFGSVEKQFHKKARLISKFMTSKTWQQIITIHTLFSFSRSKYYQAIKFLGLIVYIQHEKYCFWKMIHTMTQKLVLLWKIDPFIKNQNKL